MHQVAHWTKLLWQSQVTETWRLNHAIWLNSTFLRHAWIWLYAPLRHPVLILNVCMHHSLPVLLPISFHTFFFNVFSGWSTGAECCWKAWSLLLLALCGTQYVNHFLMVAIYRRWKNLMISWSERCWTFNRELMQWREVCHTLFFIHHNSSTSHQRNSTEHKKEKEEAEDEDYEGSPKKKRPNTGTQ